MDASAVQGSVLRIASPLRVAGAQAVHALPRSPFLSSRHGPLRLKPRFSSLGDLVRSGRGGKGGLRRKRKKQEVSDVAAGAHDAQERELLLKDLRGSQDAEALPGESSARPPEPEPAFSWLGLLLGTRRAGSRTPAAPPQQGVQAASAPGGNPRTWETGIYLHLLKAGIVSANGGVGSRLFGHAPAAGAEAPAPARLLRRPHDDAKAGVPVSGRLRGLLGGVGRWRAGLRDLLRSVESLLNGARAVLGCWFESGRFRAAGIAVAGHAGVRGWVFP